MTRPDAESIGIFLFFAGLATAIAAGTLGYIAHYDFGLSRQEIQNLAVTAAAVIGLLLAAEIFGKMLRRRAFWNKSGSLGGVARRVAKSRRLPPGK